MQAGRNVSKKNVLILNNRDSRRGPGDKPRAFIKLSYQELQSILSRSPRLDTTLSPAFPRAGLFFSRRLSTGHTFLLAMSCSGGTARCRRAAGGSRSIVAAVGIRPSRRGYSALELAQGGHPYSAASLEQHFATLGMSRGGIYS